MTPPHIEKAARAMDPLAFADWSKCPPRGMEGMRDVTIRNAQTSRQRRATKLATLVWSLAIEEAAKRVEQRRDDYIREHGNFDPETGIIELPGNGDEYIGELDEIAEDLRALAVEG